MKDYFGSSEETDNSLTVFSESTPVPVPEPGPPSPGQSGPGQPVSMPIPGSPEAMIASMAVELVETSIKCFTDYQMCKEHEETERRHIAAELKVALTKIEAAKELYKDIIIGTFAEREGLYDKAMKTVDIALERNDLEMLKVAYNLILNVYEKAPNININL